MNPIGMCWTDAKYIKQGICSRLAEMTSGIKIVQRNCLELEGTAIDDNL